MSEVTAQSLAQQARDGAVLAYPTEAVFGLGCLPDNQAAVERILQLKQRPVDKGLIVIADDLQRIAHWLDEPRIPATQRQRMQQSWPGPTTWLIPCTNACPPWIRGQHHSVAIRIPAFEPARALCSLCDSALVSTSANPAGMEPARTEQAVRDYFPDAELIIMPGQTGGSDSVSTIIDAANGNTIREAS